MTFLSFVGRVLFVSVFVFSAWQEFNDFGVDGFQVPEFEIKFLVAGAIALKALGSFLFVFGSTIGATLLILHQLIATPILYDFYNYDIEKKEFPQLFIKFTQCTYCWLGFVEFGVVRGTSVLRWDEEFHPEKINNKEGCQNEDHLREMVL
ncbi:hypothetical protein L1987_03196 [Smallanthus sonchifolius]|uniref:Uncharacterized protein n=1 Tax=Smallanthus sonchifolius TaxID=185202 RepID=A0ACB9K9V2_9ASTR|nr:hypothetical protein L1987_03196 [Smallanthus sonchifolius]